MIKGRGAEREREREREHTQASRLKVDCWHVRALVLKLAWTPFRLEGSH